MHSSLLQVEVYCDANAQIFIVKQPSLLTLGERKHQQECLYRQGRKIAPAPIHCVYSCSLDAVLESVWSFLSTTMTRNSISQQQLLLTLDMTRKQRFLSINQPPRRERKRRKKRVSDTRRVTQTSVSAVLHFGQSSMISMWMNHAVRLVRTDCTEHVHSPSLSNC